MSKAALPGSAREWHRRTLALALPIIVSNLSVPLVGAVDTAVVGHLPQPHQIGAVAIGSTIFSFLFWGLGFLRMSTTGFVAQAHGNADPGALRATVERALLLAMILGLLLVLCHAPLGRLALGLFDSAPGIRELASTYFSVRIWSAPATLANYAVLGTLIGLQRTRLALITQLALNGCNVCLDLVLVMGLGFGVGGVALASVVSEYLALLLGLYLLARRTPIRSAPRQALRDWAAMAALLRANINIMLRTLCLLAAFGYFTARGARLGDTVLAGNAVLMHLQHFLAFGLDGFAHATEALAGSAYGAGDRQAFRRAFRTTSFWALIVALTFALCYALLGMRIIGLMTSLEEVLDLARAHMPWLVISPLLSVWSFQLDGLFIGATRSAEMRNAMLASLALFLLSCALLVPAWGNHGLWASLMLFMVIRALTLGAYYPRLERALA